MSGGPPDTGGGGMFRGMFESRTNEGQRGNAVGSKQRRMDRNYLTTG